MNLLEASFWGAVLGGALRLATPLAIAALGELFVQRAGYVNLGIEGMMLCGCLAGVVGSNFGGWPVGLLLGAATGVALGALLAAAVLLGKADVIVAGIGTGLLAAGLSDYAFDLWSRRGADVAFALAPTLAIPAALHWPALLAQIFGQSVITWVTLAAAVVVAAALRFGRAGPVLEAVGREPDIARLRGVAVSRWQAASLILGGTLAATAGAAMTVAYVGSFSSGMTGGRGFIAIAVVILGQGRPTALGIACLGFAALESAGLQLQGRASASIVALGAALPYLATLAALAVHATARGTRLRSAAAG